MGLRLDINGLINEILNKLETELRWAFEAWETEVYQKLKTPEFADNAEVEAKLHRESNTIIAYLKANPVAIADSYGTGSLMLDNIPGFQEYRNDKNRWNSARTGKTIVGRPKGEYTDIFGNKRSSRGSMEGLDVEGLELWNGDKIEPVSPSYALQDAEKFLYATYLPRAYKLAIQNVNFSKYLIEK